MQFRILSSLRYLFFLILFVFASFPGAVSAQSVTAELNGLSLSGHLEMAGGGAVQNQHILILVHGTLESAESETIRNLQQGFRSQGVNTLAITLSLGFDNRRGDFNCNLEQDHRHEDAVLEIAAWVNWLKLQKAGSISLLGYERGANQAALYVQRHLLDGQSTLEPTGRKKAPPQPDKNIAKLILINPISGFAETVDADYMAQFNQPLGQFVQAAQGQVEQENANNLIENVPFLKCPSARVTASGFLNYYVPNPNQSILTLLADLKKPSLLLVSQSHALSDNFRSIVEEQVSTGQGQVSLAQISDDFQGGGSINIQNILSSTVPFLKK